MTNDRINWYETLKFQMETDRKYYEQKISALEEEVERLRLILIAERVR